MHIIYTDGHSMAVSADAGRRLENLGLIESHPGAGADHIDASDYKLRDGVQWKHVEDALGDFARRAVPLVICLRDPDASNEFHKFGDVDIIDVDAGRSDLSDDDEFREWYSSHIETVARLARAGRSDAATALKEIIDSYADGITRPPCTGGIDSLGQLVHDGDTCPYHEGQ